jgi:hypothetical protein
MALLIQGFGTAFVGQRDFWSNGSYLTTEWIVLFFVPVLPLKTMRVRSVEYENSGFYQKEGYVIHQTMPIHIRQVLSVYAFTISYIAYLSAVLWIAIERISQSAFEELNWVGFAAFIAVIASPWAVPFYLRRRARHRVRA